MRILTGSTGANHVTAADDGALYAGIIGSGSYVLDIGQKFAATVVNATTVKLADGDGVLQGRHFRTDPGETDTVTIEDGSLSTNRNDVIGVRYIKDAGVESMAWQVIKGTATTGTATDPTYDEGDVLGGESSAFMPMYRVKLSGANLSAIEPMFSILTTARDHAMDKSNPHGVTFKQVVGADILPTSKGGTGNASGRAASAASADTATKLAAAKTIQTNLGSTSAASFDGSGNVTPGVTGVLPLSNGGLGATTGAGACANIGAVKKSGDTMTGALTVDECIYGNSVASRLTGDSKRFALMRSGSDAAVLQSNDANWSGKNWLALHDDHTSLHKPLDVGSGGTGATNAATACNNIGAVKKSGDTMTGDLIAPRYVVKGTDDGWDGMDILRSSDGEYRCGVTAMGGANNLVFREKKPNGATEYYKLPIPTVTDDAWYNILTDKSPVTIAQGGTGSTTRAGAIDTLVNAGGVDDANTASDIGIFTYGTTASNTPYTSWGTIFTFQGNQPWLNQIAITTDNPPHIFYRTNINGAGWGSWLELYTKGNVVYSSSQPAVIDGGIWLKPI